jgi:hypothetical protein
MKQQDSRVNVVLYYNTRLMMQNEPSRGYEMPYYTRDHFSQPEMQQKIYTSLFCENRT